MSDKEGGTSQADGAAQSQADNAGASQSQADFKTVKDLPDWAQKEIRDARKEAADFRTKLQKIEDKDKTESERLTSRLETLEKDNEAKAAALRERDARETVRDAATKAGASDPNLIYRTVKGDIEFDADGAPTNVESVIKDLKQTAPQLFRKSTGPADAGGGREQRAQPTGDWMRSAFASRRGG